MDLIKAHFDLVNPLWIEGVEPKASELFSLSRSDKAQEKLSPGQKSLVDAGLNTKPLVDALIENVYQFLADPPVPLRYVGAVTHKKKYFEKLNIYTSWEKAKRFRLP